MKTVLMVGPSRSIHTQLWVDEFLRAGWHVEQMSLPPMSRVPKSVGLAFAVARTWLRGPSARADLMVVHSLGTHAVASLMLRRAWRTVVVPWGSEVDRLTESRVRSLTARWTLRRADAVLVTSFEMRQRLELFWVDSTKLDIFVNSWGVDPEFLVDERRQPLTHLPAILDSDVLVVAPRGPGAVYRNDQLLAAFRSARRLRPELKLALVGLDAVDPNAADRPCEGTVWLGTLSRSEMLAWLDAADVVVSIPLSDQRSTTTLEAVARGAHILLSSAPSYVEMKDQGAVVHTLAEPVEAALAEALTRIDKRDVEVAVRNLQWARLHENRSTNFARILQICESLVRPRQED